MVSNWMRGVRGLFLSLAVGFAPAVFAQAEGSFAVIDPPQAVEAPGKIEVLDFFQYGCPHCRRMQPLVENWSAQLPDDVVVRHIPVAFNASMGSWQRLYYTLEALKRMDLQPAVFAAVQDGRQPLNNRERVLEWAGKQQGIDLPAFTSAYDSFSVVTNAKRAEQLVNNYRIESVPTMVVQGRYMTSPAQARGYEQTVQVVDALVQRARQEAGR